MAKTMMAYRPVVFALRQLIPLPPCWVTCLVRFPWACINGRADEFRFRGFSEGLACCARSLLKIVLIVAR